MILGHQIQGDWIADDGSTYQPVTVYFELLRLWDSRAVWHKMESDTAALEANIRFAKSRNAKVMFTFGEPPESVLLPGYAKVPTMDAWEAFIRRVIAEGKGRIDVYEGWNEPGYPQYWDGTPELLVPYQRRLFELCRELAPGKPVLSPSFVRVELADGQVFLRRFKAAGGLQWCDGFAWHGYAARTEDLRGQHAAIRTFTDLPLHNTEFVIGSRFESRALIDAFMLMHSLDVKCGVYNPELPGFEDYTSPIMQQVRDQFNAPTTRKGCNPFRR